MIRSWLTTSGNWAGSGVGGRPAATLLCQLAAVSVSTKWMTDIRRQQ
jgi:hypothetical protein